MSVLGINKAGVSAIQKAIKDYQRDINRSKEMMKMSLVNANLHSFMKGDNTINTMKKYVNQVCDETEVEINAYLNSISSEISTVYNEYAKNDKSAMAFTTRIKKS